MPDNVVQHWVAQYNTGNKHNFKYWLTCQNGTSRFFWWRVLITKIQKIDDCR